MTEPKKRLVELGQELAKDIEKGKQPKLDVPVRALSNVQYNERTKTLELGKKSAERIFFNVGHVKKFVQTLEVAKVSKQLLDLGKHASLRDVFYMAKRTIPGSNINIVDEQTESDKAIEDLELITEFSREQLNINANKNGSVAGQVIIEDKGDAIDWSKLGSGGWSIPSNVEEIKFKKVSADYVIYMEKAAVWERLHEDKYWDKHKCIILTSQGQTTRGIRRLLQRLNQEHKLPVYVLCDFDAYGFYIYSVLKFGSINLAHISESQAIPSAKFLGITADDIEKYGLSKHLIKMKDVDIARLKQISEYDWFKNNKAWQRQFKLMKQYGAKAEIQALSARGITFISEKYLPEKIKAKDWLD
ncbi:DNA topoisomerase IV subunit A [Candidatus Woesearchaeota archaeon]|nr:DNA topoisomerase IV subunit A [Candidatus Woesearchaeota archaeon]